MPDIQDVNLVSDANWLKRMNAYFDSVCIHGNGLLTIEEIQQWATNIEKICCASPNEMVKLRAQLYTFWGQIGLLPGKALTKKQFIDGINRLAKFERARKNHGQITYHEMIGHAFFDVIDTNKDGVLTVDELKNALLASKMDPSGANKWLLAADSNKNGHVERHQLLNSEFRFWFHPG